LASFDWKGYARRGAEMRVSEVKAELQAIYRAFPDLATEQRPGRRRSPSAASYTDDGQTIQPGEPVARKRRRRKMSAAERKAVGERMRKYWAARKQARQ
jgi:hypothetical protein